MSGESAPTWSIVIPVYNCAHYLAEALPVVVEQFEGRDDVEVVVLDDGSKDDPASVVEQFGGGITRYSPNPEHLGAIGTFNRAIGLARGELIHLLHGDDGVFPGFYSAMEQALQDQTAVAAVCRTAYMEDDGSAGPVTRSNRSGSGIWETALHDLAVSNRVPPPSVVVRRRTYDEVGTFRLDLPHAADWEMWARLAAHGPIAYVDEPLARYRRHEGSDTAGLVRTGTNVRERVQAIRHINGYVTDGDNTAILRRALGYSSVFAGRTSLRLLRRRDFRGAGWQALEAGRCLLLAAVPSFKPLQP